MRSSVHQCSGDRLMTEYADLHRMVSHTLELIQKLDARMDQVTGITSEVTTALNDLRREMHDESQQTRDAAKARRAMEEYDTGVFDTRLASIESSIAALEARMDRIERRIVE